MHGELNMKISNEESNQIILSASEEEFESLCKRHEEHLTALLNDPNATEEQINAAADKILILSTSVDITNHQPMELNPKFVKKPNYH